MPVDHKVSRSVWNRYEQLRDDGHLKFVEKDSKCNDFFVGDQWSKADLALLNAQQRPAMTVNKILSTVSNVLGEQIYNRTDIAFRPRNRESTTQVADALTKVFMQIADNNSLSWVRSDVFCDGIIGSRGFYDVRLDMTDSLMGEVRVKRLNPKNVMIDSNAEDYDPDTWADVLTTRWLSPDDVELMYSKADADALRTTHGGMGDLGVDAFDFDRDRFGGPRRNYNILPETPTDEHYLTNIRVIERQFRTLDRTDHLVDVLSGDMRVLPADWDRDMISHHLEKNPTVTVTKKLIKRIRWQVVAGSQVLHDDWSPYKHFTVVPFFPHLRSGRTVGIVENLINPQEVLNKVTSQELHVVNTTANSGWKLKKNSLSNMDVPELEQRGAQTGLVLELNEVGDAEKITPNQVPTGLERVSYKADESIKTISGVSDYMRGEAREDVAAKSVVANQRSGQANLARVMDNLNRTDTLLARSILDIVQGYYTEPRLIKITTDKLMNETQELEVNQVSPEGTIINDLTIGEYAVVVTSQPERDTFEDSQFDHAVRMRTEAGVQIPDSFIIKSSRLRDKEQIIKAMEGDKDSPEAQEAAALQKRAQEAEVASTEAEAMRKQADAKLKDSKAAEAESGDMAIKLAEIKANADLEREKMQMEFDFKRAQSDKEFKLKREQAEREFALKREEAERERALEREEAAKKATEDRVATARKAADSAPTT